MKLLTNIQSVKVGGITNSFSTFLHFLEKYNEGTKVVGVDIIRKYTNDRRPLFYRRRVQGRNTIISQEILCRRIHDVLVDIKSLKDLENEYQEIIDVFRKIVKKERPDLIVLSGTYFIPWCLYLAAKDTDTPIVLRYHGTITKESEHWDAHSHGIMKQMEQTFDNSRLRYIFPSQLAKKIVEKEVFGHRIYKGAIIPNPIHNHFFEINNKNKAKNIGVVGRWSEIKNTDFIVKLANHNEKKNNLFSINFVTELGLQEKKQKEFFKKINFHRPMSSLKLGSFYGKMGAVICPSKFECYGNVAQEAIASGTPALIGSNMGVAEQFRRVGLGNLIVDFSSVRNIYEKMKEVSKLTINKEVRRKMRDELSPDRLYPQLLNLYNSYIN